MSLSVSNPSVTNPAWDRVGFALAAGGVAIGAATLAGWFPLGFSIVAVILFAGPHNWMELRYFLSKMPSRWGARRLFYTLGLGGALGLSAMFIGGSLFAEWLLPTEFAWRMFGSSWNTLLLLWLAALIWLRGRETPGRDWAWIWPLAFLLIAGAWLFPLWWDIGLVYLHPLIALCFLQREIRRRRPQWLPIYYGVGVLAVGLLGVLYWRLADAPPLPGDDALSQRIAWVAGGELFQHVSTHFLVAAHAYLEMLHYVAWIVAIPLLVGATRSWKMKDAPLAKKSLLWKRSLQICVLAGAGIVLLLWAGFAVDHATTRNVYFTFAIFHVLAEFTFLIGAV